MTEGIRTPAAEWDQRRLDAIQREALERMKAPATPDDAKPVGGLLGGVFGKLGPHI